MAPQVIYDRRWKYSIVKKCRTKLNAPKTGDESNIIIFVDLLRIDKNIYQ
jgi:hypothetical protein